MIPTHRMPSVAAYRVLLRLLPTAFHESYGASMLDTFVRRVEDARANRSWLARQTTIVRELIGLGGTVVAQRLARSKKRNIGQRARHASRLSSSVNEARSTVRRLLRSPGFSVISVITLALGIGATTAMFSVVYNVVLKPLPYPNADRVVVVDHGASGIGSTSGLGMTPGLFPYYGERGRTLQAIAIYDRNEYTITGDGEPARVKGSRATHTLQDVLQVSPILGRWFQEQDANGQVVVVLSEQLWVRRFGSDSGIVGRSIRLNGVVLEIIGVMPAHFRFPDPETELWMPYIVRDLPDGLGGFWVRGVARLAAGVTPTDAMAELDRLIGELPQVFANGWAQQLVHDAKLKSIVKSFKAATVGRLAQTLWILLGTVSIVLLIACANVANLFLVRTESRQREITIRRALGAAPGQIVRLFVAESLVLGAIGGVLGTALAFVGSRFLRSWGPDVPRLADVSIDTTVLAFTALISLMAGLLFGVVPAVRASRAPGNALGEGGRSGTVTKRRLTIRNALATAQVALALVLLTGSALMVRSFSHVVQVDTGFRAEQTLTFQIGLPASQYSTREQAAAFHQELLDGINAVEGVASAGAVSCLPLSGWCGGDPLSVRGRVLEPGEIPPIISVRTISPGYLETMQIPVTAGRTFTRSDHEQPTNAVVVSTELVRRYFPNEDPIDQLVYRGGQADSLGAPWFRIVGVVGDIHALGLTDGVAPTMYFPMVAPGHNGPTTRALVYVVRTSGNPMDILPAVRTKVAGLDRSVPVANVRLLEEVVSDARAQAAFAAIVIVIAAVVALTLGTVGVYGVIAYIMSQRRWEIGLRLALGAQHAVVLRMVLRTGVVLAVTGIAIGGAGALALTRFMEAMLFGVSPNDPLTYGATAVGMLMVVLLAAWVPAVGASRVDPVNTLREG